MKCPKCYGRVEKQSGVCTKCGFETKNLIYASNKKAKELKRSGDGDLVIESSVLPNDVSKKRLLMMCGFLGLFGAHYFYVGKFVRGLTNLVISVYS
ncbi:MAG: NINE protein, partial [Christensenellales bacterium]